MIGQFGIGSALIVLSIVIHAVFMVFAARAVRRRGTWLRQPPALPKRAGILTAVSLWLMASMSVTVWIWAFYFLWVGALEDLETAIYFSLVSFTTLGFGDIVLAPPHRLLSGMLAANGLVLFGMTAAELLDLIRNLHAAKSDSSPDS
ncbi:MAG: potassium channel family protein [Paracoccaceae bacterium]|nr:potassium channel family protein [Paracoccaceae bacterium]